MAISDYAIVILMFAVLAVLLGGIVLMGIGGKANEKYGNKLMIARVSLQGLAILALVGGYFLSKH